MDKKEFGQYLKSLRKAKGLTLVGLAEISGVSNPYISQIENGKFLPTPDTLKKLSKGLDVEYLELMQIAGFTDKKSLLDNLRLKAINLQEKIMKITKEINQFEIYLSQNGWGDTKDLKKHELPEDLKHKMEIREKILLVNKKELDTLLSKIQKLEKDLDLEKNDSVHHASSFFELFNFGLPSAYRFNEEKEGIMTQSMKSYPVNDLSFHLSDPLNKKLYKEVVLSDDDRSQISSLIESYLLRKYINTEEGEQRENLISLLTERESKKED